MFGAGTWHWHPRESLANGGDGDLVAEEIIQRGGSDRLVGLGAPADYLSRIVKGDRPVTSAKQPATLATK